MSSRTGNLATPRAPWILSPVLDTFGLLGSVAVSWALYAAWRAAWLSTSQVVMLWIFVLHGPHFFATLTRTALSPVDRERWGPTYKRALLWFVVGPAMLGAALLLSLPDLGKLFFFLAAMWAFHHVVKQHFGFVALYRARNGVFDRVDMRLTRYYLILSLWIPVLLLMSGSAHWLFQVPGFQALLDHFGAERAETFVYRTRTVLPWIFWTLQALYVGSRLLRLARGKAIAWPELLVVGASVSLNWVVGNGILSVVTDPVLAQADPLAAYVMVPIITAYHNIQYHVLVCFYNRRRYAGEPAHGLAGRMSANFGLYLAGGVAYTLVTIGTEHYGIAGLQDPSVQPWFAAFLWGFSLAHYWVDGKIWKVSEDRELQAALGFQRP